MKFSFRNISLSAFALLMTGSSYQAAAQQDQTLYFMPGIPQSVNVNPATVPTSRINIALPVIGSQYYAFSNRTFPWNELFDTYSRKDTLMLTAGHIFKHLQDRNYFSQNAQIDLISGGFAVGEKNYFFFNVSEKMTSTLTYTKDFVRFLWEGNAMNLVEKRASFDGMGYDMTHYQEYAMGYSRKINSKLTLGAKLKYLNGTENAWTKASQLGIYTGPKNPTGPDDVPYQLTVDGNIQAYSSGLNYSANNPPLKDDIGSNSLKYNPNYTLNRGNHGFGIDLGGAYQYNDRLNISASVIDLGYIHWTSDIHNYSKTNLNTTIKGFEIRDMFDGSKGINRNLDSMKKIFNLEENHSAYTSYLYPMIHLGGSYRLSDRNTGGLLLYTQLYKGYLRPGATVSFNSYVKKWLSTSVSYSYFAPASWKNLGLGVALNGGPVQFYVVSDNALAAVMPRSVEDVHVRFGFNIRIGRKAPESLNPEKKDDKLKENTTGTEIKDQKAKGSAGSKHTVRKKK